MTQNNVFCPGSSNDFLPKFRTGERKELITCIHLSYNDQFGLEKSKFKAWVRK